MDFICLSEWHQFIIFIFILFSFLSFRATNSFLAGLDWGSLESSFSPKRFIHSSLWREKRKFLKIELMWNINLIEGFVREEWLRHLHCHNGERLAWVRLACVQRLCKLTALICRVGQSPQLLAGLLKQGSYTSFHVVCMWLWGENVFFATQTVCFPISTWHRLKHTRCACAMGEDAAVVIGSVWDESTHWPEAAEFLKQMFRQDG